MSDDRIRTRRRGAVLVAVLVLLATTTSRAGIFTVFGPRTLTRTAGSPDVFTFTFSAANPSLPYTLRIDNHGVNSAVVTLNGVQVVGPNEFKSTKDDDWKKAADWDDGDWERDDDWRRDRHWKAVMERSVHLEVSKFAGANRSRAELAVIGQSLGR